jgi:phosphoribosylformimino-5-aminoimidazole carboxamide ribotide isomerase
MQIIPVIDLLNGVVVHAQRGDRKNYQPIQSALTTSHQPLDIVAALLEIYPFKELYIADLNAIQKTSGIHSDNYDVITKIKQHYHALNVWVDAGISNKVELDRWHLSGVNLVIGSENFTQLDDYLVIKELLQGHFMLSLDFMLGGYQGPLAMRNEPNYWPEKVIVMSLANVGANQGPSIELLKNIQSLAPHKQIYAAGGVRQVGDLMEMKKLGVGGALIASALHQKQLKGPDFLMLNDATLLKKAKQVVSRFAFFERTNHHH